MQTVLVKFKQMKSQANILNAVISPCTASVPGLRLQLVFRTLQQVKLMHSKRCISMLKWQCWKIIVRNRMYVTYTKWLV